MIPYGLSNIFDFVFKHIYIHFKYHANEINYLKKNRIEKNPHIHVLKHCILFSFFTLIYLRRIKSSKVTLSGNLLSCWKKSLYQDIVVKNDENSTYQELDVSDSTYQNTAIP